MQACMFIIRLDGYWSRPYLSVYIYCTQIPQIDIIQEQACVRLQCVCILWWRRTSRIETKGFQQFPARNSRIKGSLIIMTILDSNYRTCATGCWRRPAKASQKSWIYCCATPGPHHTHNMWIVWQRPFERKYKIFFSSSHRPIICI